MCAYTCFFFTAVVRYLLYRVVCNVRDEQNCSFELLIAGWWPRWLSSSVVVCLRQARQGAAGQLRVSTTPQGLLEGDPSWKTFCIIQQYILQNTNVGLFRARSFSIDTHKYV